MSNWNYFLTKALPLRYVMVYRVYNNMTAIISVCTQNVIHYSVYIAVPVVNVSKEAESCRRDKLADNIKEEAKKYFDEKGIQ